MDHKGIVKLCRALGCCDACCLRFIGLKNPAAYENCHQHILQYLEESTTDDKSAAEGPQDKSTNEKASTDGALNEPTNDKASVDGTTDILTNEKQDACSNDVETNGMDEDRDTENPTHNGTPSDSPPAKRRRQSSSSPACVSCLGVLQESSWQSSLDLAKEMFQHKNYECSTFAAALSSPMSVLVRQRAVAAFLRDWWSDYDFNTITPLKEAWKWSFAEKLATHIGKPLDSGAVSPLLVTLNMEYPDDLQELEILKTLSPSLFESRRQQSRRFALTFTRRAVDDALDDVTVEKLKAVEGWGLGPPHVSGVQCASAVWVRAPMYLGGRYIKLSRTLPQTPWRVGGEAGGGGVEGSVQDTIFHPIAELLGIPPEDTEARLKLMSAGREDVDVRCLGDGRPFAVEITDPRRELTTAELHTICDRINASGDVLVKQLVYISKDELSLLKKGEESKCKTYEALCIKLTHSDRDKEGDMVNGTTPPCVTPSDISLLNSYRTMPPPVLPSPRITIRQKTPIRVLHRRPLLVRERSILDLEAHTVPDHPQLFVIRVRTSAGTYVKEWVHGELGRTTPSLASVLGARVDLLALDVASVELPWPPTKDCDID